MLSFNYFAYLIDHLVLKVLELLVVVDGNFEFVEIDAVRAALEVEVVLGDLLLDTRMEDQVAVVVEHDDVDADAHLVLGRHLADETQHGHVDAHDAEQHLLLAQHAVGHAQLALLDLLCVALGRCCCCFAHSRCRLHFAATCFAIVKLRRLLFADAVSKRERREKINKYKCELNLEIELKFYLVSPSPLAALACAPAASS